MIPGGEAPRWDDDDEAPHLNEIGRQIARLMIWLHAHARSTVLDGDLVTWFHRQVFASVSAQYAGAVRGPNCPFDVHFGPHLGAPWQECEEQFATLSDTFVQYIGALDGLSRGEVRESALNVACSHHAQFIKMHPFLNGNGRIGRIAVNYFSARYGLHYISLDRSEQVANYERALTVFIREGRLAPLVDLWRPLLSPLNMS